MANNYTRASFCIDIPDGVSMLTLQFAMSMIETLHEILDASAEEAQAAIDTVLASIPSETVKDESKKLVTLLRDELGVLEDTTLGFDWILEEASADQERQGHIWIYGDESVNIASAVRCIQALAIAVPEMQTTSPWYATWANTCSKQRVDEFDGGAVVFDHEHAEWMDAMSWKNQTMENFKTIKAAQSVKPDGG